jgi:hypothetical protein
VAIFQRIRSILISGMIEEINKYSRDGMTAIIDSSGFKVTERGDWLSTKWKGKRKGWIKMHIAIDGDSMNIQINDSPLIQGYEVYNIFIKPHIGLNGKTPEDMAGIEIQGKNKWKAIIENAAISRKVTANKNEAMSL